MAAPEAGRGWTLIELLLASVLFLVALLAAAPLFMRAVHDVRTGAARSAASALAQNGLELSTPPARGAATYPASRVEYYSFERRLWLASPPVPPDRALWVRETTRRRYPLSAIADGRLDAGESAPSGPGRPRSGPRVWLVGVEVRVSRRLGSQPVASLERLEWTGR